MNRRIGFVVRRKSSIMLRSSAAFSKSSFSAASAHLFLERDDHFARMAFEKIARLHRRVARYCSVVISLNRVGT